MAEITIQIVQALLEEAFPHGQPLTWVTKAEVYIQGKGDIVIERDPPTSEPLVCWTACFVPYDNDIVGGWTKSRLHTVEDVKGWVANLVQERPYLMELP